MTEAIEFESAVMREGFVVLPRAVVADGRLAPGARLLYGLVLMHAWSGGGFPSQAALGRALGVGDRQVRNHLNELVALGYLDRRRKADGMVYVVRDVPTGNIFPPEEVAPDREVPEATGNIFPDCALPTAWPEEPTGNIFPPEALAPDTNSGEPTGNIFPPGTILPEISFRSRPLREREEKERTKEREEKENSTYVPLVHDRLSDDINRGSLLGKGGMGGKPFSLSARRPVDEEFVRRMVEKYGDRLGGEEGVRLEIERALNHKASLKAIDKRLYVQVWLRREAQWREERRNAAGRNGARELVPLIAEND